MNLRSLTLSFLSITLCLSLATPAEAKKNKFDLAKIRTVAFVGVTVQQVNSADTQVYQDAADAASALFKLQMEENEGWLFVFPSAADLGDTDLLTRRCASKHPKTGSRARVHSGGPVVSHGTAIGEKYNQDGAVVKSFSFGKKESGPNMCQAALGELAKSLGVDAVLSAHITTSWGLPVTGASVIASGRRVGEFLAQAGVVIVDRRGTLAFQAGSSSVEQFSPRFSGPVFKGRNAAAKYLDLSHGKLPGKAVATVENALLLPMNNIKGKLKKIVKNSGTAVQRGGKLPAPKEASAAEEAPAAEEGTGTEGSEEAEAAPAVAEEPTEEELVAKSYEDWADQSCACTDYKCVQEVTQVSMTLKPLDNLPLELRDRGETAKMRGMKCAMSIKPSF